MNSEITIEEIRSQFLDPNWTTELIENRELEPKKAEDIRKYIVDQLNSDEDYVRYISSLMIIQFKIESAKSKLIERILDSNTLGNNGSMTYALLHLNCEDKLVDVFRILASQTWESKNHAYTILSEQIFEFSRSDLYNLDKIWNDVLANQTKNQIYDSETLEMIENAYLGFKTYQTDEQ